MPSAGGCGGLDCDSVPLAALRTGQHGTVSCLPEPESREARKLVALGVLPGVQLRMMQRYPGYVFRMGHSEFAIDAAMADHIRVFPE